MQEFIEKPHQGPIVIKAKSSNEISDAYRDSLTIAYQYLGEVVNPDVTFEIGNRKFATPIMAGVCNLKTVPGEVPELTYASAVNEAGSVYWAPFFGKDNHKKVLELGIPAIRVIKPLRNIEDVIAEVNFEEENGAIGYAMDIDHSYSVYGKPDENPVFQYGPKTLDDLRRINDCSELPFFLKGVLSVHDALAAKMSGVYGIVISGHNNRFPCMTPPLKLLPEIRKAVGNELMILVDGGINNGYDAFKALALGADGVLSARALLGAMSKEGPDGMTQKLLEMTEELKGAMANTGSKDLKHINKECIVKL